ncbi:MAG: ABC transporter permease [Rhodospirillales bacterium]|nr:ABC transporter permease [Rhodospirillales bacterium]MCB9995455.1 ABC transporter permease [Rhodospirillales bacterium]
MSDSQTVQQAPEPRKIGRLNIEGLKTLIWKEVGRFLSVYTQTIVAPVITTLLFFAVFALAFGGIEQMAGDMPFLEFLAPGLIMMAMVQNAFANTSSSLMISKMQGNIVDVLMPPLSATELLLGYAVGGVLRGLCVGVTAGIAISFFVEVHIHSVVVIALYAFLGTLLLALLGIAGGIWSEKFDHISAVTNFLVTPMTFLSGTFYSIDRLPEFWRMLAHYNPFFHMIDGFRSGFIGYIDGDLMTGIITLFVVNAGLAALSLQMLRTGYKIKS